jgi:DNA invertase Pin-like site-specific DNA recombinase
MTRVAVYTRISRDPLGEGRAPDRQLTEATRLAHLRDWEVVAEYRDVDVSAYQQRWRPAFEDLVEDTRARRFDGVLVWKLDRLVRRPSDFERFWLVAEPAGVFIASATEPIDSSTNLGVAFVRILVAMAGLESATSGERIRAVKRERAMAGIPPSAKAYGLDPTWTAIVPEEAERIREAVARAIAGERLASIARDWRFKGIAGPRGGAWSDGVLCNMLRNRRLVGDRVYRGEVVARGCWPAIVDTATFDRLQLALNRPDRKGAPRRHGQRLLTGLATCARCGQSMNTTTRSGQRYYSCPTNPTRCGRTHVRADPTETWVVGQALARLVTSPLVHADRRAPEPAPLANRLRQLALDYYSADIIGRDEFLAARRALVADAERLDAGEPGVERWKPQLCRDRKPGAAFSRLPSPHQRAVLADAIERVDVHAADKARWGRFHPGRLRIVWTDPG